MESCKDDTNDDLQTYNIRSFFQNFPNGVILLTPHSASLHVGLKSFVPTGHPASRNFLFSYRTHVNYLTTLATWYYFQLPAYKYP
ncbi:hypothetical protein Barb4_01060 [Bacteroidales bacterium Barb4]|nr:hypothetical protein Barb4_01060 [Bacteroidales bacterium Barb4]